MAGDRGFRVKSHTGLRMTLLTLSIAPVICLILIFYFKDRYEKKPILLLCKSFVLGSGGLRITEGMADGRILRNRNGAFGFSRKSAVERKRPQASSTSRSSSNESIATVGVHRDSPSWERFLLWIDAAE